MNRLLDSVLACELNTSEPFHQVSSLNITESVLCVKMLSLQTAYGDIQYQGMSKYKYLLKEVSCAHQGSIYLIKTYGKKQYCDILLQFKWLVHPKMKTCH